MLDRRCLARHLGLWLMEPICFEQYFAQIKAGILPAKSDEELQAAMRRAEEAPLYDVTKQGIAIIDISGPMMKGMSKYGGTSTVLTRKALREAVGDELVKGIILHIDSPGGSVAGTGDLGRDVAMASAAKPTFVQADDLMASAALWVGSQAGRVFAGPETEVGSIGVVVVVEDTSGAAEMSGIQVHVVSTGDYKGAFADGAPITEDQLTYLQTRVDELNGHFMKAVGMGRRMSMARVQAAADGRVFGAAKAQELGLIDGVATMDETMAMLAKRIARDEKARQRDARMRDARLEAI